MDAFSKKEIISVLYEPQIEMHLPNQGQRKTWKFLVLKRLTDNTNFNPVYFLFK